MNHHGFDFGMRGHVPSLLQSNDLDDLGHKSGAESGVLLLQKQPNHHNIEYADSHEGEREHRVGRERESAHSEPLRVKRDRDTSVSDRRNRPLMRPPRCRL